MGEGTRKHTEHTEWRIKLENPFKAAQSIFNIFIRAFVIWDLSINRFPTESECVVSGAVCRLLFSSLCSFVHVVVVIVVAIFYRYRHILNFQRYARRRRRHAHDCMVWAISVCGNSVLVFSQRCRCVMRQHDMRCQSISNIHTSHTLTQTAHSRNVILLNSHF